MNNYIKSKKELEELNVNRAEILVTIKHMSQELPQLRADMAGTGADDPSINKYTKAKAKLEAMKDVLADIDDRRLPVASHNVTTEKVIADGAARTYLGNKKAVAVLQIQKIFDSAIKAMDQYKKDVIDYARAQGNPAIPRMLSRVGITDMDHHTKKYLL